MSKRPLPLSVSEAVEQTRRATHLLLQAAKQGDSAMIEEAIVDRAQAVALLERALEGPEGYVLDAGTRAELLESISLQAHEAESELRELQDRVREELQTISYGVKAVKGYATAPLDGSSALDRSG